MADVEKESEFSLDKRWHWSMEGVPKYCVGQWTKVRRSSKLHQSKYIVIKFWKYVSCGVYAWEKWRNLLKTYKEALFSIISRVCQRWFFFPYLRNTVRKESNNDVASVTKIDWMKREVADEYLSKAKNTLNPAIVIVLFVYVSCVRLDKDIKLVAPCSCSWCNKIATVSWIYLQKCKRTKYAMVTYNSLKILYGIP